MPRAIQATSEGLTNQLKTYTYPQPVISRPASTPGSIFGRHGGSDLDRRRQHQVFAAFHEAGKVAAALCHGVAVLAFARDSRGEPIAKGKTVTGFANVEEDFADNAVWAYGLLPRDRHVMPWRIEDRLKALGANSVQAGLWRSFAVHSFTLDDNKPLQ